MRRIISFLILVSAFICVIAQSKGPEFPGGGVQYQLFQPGTNNIMTIQQMVDAKCIKVIEIPF